MSKHTREERIARLSAASEQKKQDALDATEKAIRKLQQEGKVISFNAVAREAQVSTSYLYKYPELKNKIAKLREEQKRSGRKIPVASDNSKNRIIGHLKKRIKDLEQEVTQLRQANESLAGRVFELEEYENTVERFRKHNEKLNAEIERLAEENTDLKDKLGDFQEINYRLGWPDKNIPFGQQGVWFQSFLNLLHCLARKSNTFLVHLLTQVNYRMNSLPGHARSPSQHRFDIGELGSIPMLLENPPTPLNRVVLAVVGWIVQ